ncbi:MAG TPA: hypothetical protein EYQ61_11520 [Dehalococcoidia bacterium]|jgi:hypothetical protein|nr:hypothetical protein [Dehalococcoidia bacterium]HIK89362.1 hypothetical protein [Dehalococcoidia bacterium]
MSSEHDSSKPESQSSDKPEDDGFQRAKRLDPGTPEPGEEIQLNMKKFALVLGAILIFAVIAAMFKQFVSGS